MSLKLPSMAIVTPSYNQVNFIQRTIDSVLGQDYPELEYLIKDGGSDDGTLDLLKSYQSQVKWTSGRDTGQSAAIDTGWKETQGEIIAWVNSDDLLTPGALRFVGKYFLEHPEIDWLYGDCDYIDENDVVIRPYPTRDFDYCILVRDAINFIPQPATFMRRSAAERAGLLDEQLSYVMDMDLWLKLGLESDGVHIARKLASLRLHRGAKSVANFGKFAAELVTIYQRLFARTDLSEAIRDIEPEAMHNIYLRASDCAYWGNLQGEARRFAWRSFQYNPWRIHRLWLYLLLGSTGRKLFASQNPYVN